jgi:transcriptional antiterminator NusG
VDDQILDENQNQIPESAPMETPVPEPVAEETVAPTPEPESANETEVSIETSETEAETSALEKPAGPQRAWYAVHCYSGYENKVKKGLEQRIRSMGMQDNIFRVIVPTEDEIDVREGQRKVIQRRVFPGYILVEMIMTEESWYVVRNTPGVTGFVSSGDKPAPLREEEVSKILKRMETDQPKVRVTYRPGQAVRIVDGPFTDFRGTVEEVNMEKGKVRVLVSMFGRETPLELDLLQVEKV